MKPEEQRIAIAEVCGWKRSDTYDYSLYGRVLRTDSDVTERVPAYEKEGLTKRSEDLPGYIDDLNAIHDARSIIQNDTGLRVEYLNQLRRVIGGLVSDFDLINARADQHAKALLKALGKWKE